MKQLIYMIPTFICLLSSSHAYAQQSGNQCDALKSEIDAVYQQIVPNQHAIVSANTLIENLRQVGVAIVIIDNDYRQYADAHDNFTQTRLFSLRDNTINHFGNGGNIQTWTASYEQTITNYRDVMAGFEDLEEKIQLFLRKLSVHVCVRDRISRVFEADCAQGNTAMQQECQAYRDENKKANEVLDNIATVARENYKTADRIRNILTPTEGKARGYIPAMINMIGSSANEKHERTCAKRASQTCHLSDLFQDTEPFQNAIQGLDEHIIELRQKVTNVRNSWVQYYPDQNAPQQVNN